MDKMWLEQEERQLVRPTHTYIQPRALINSLKSVSVSLQDPVVQLDSHIKVPFFLFLFPLVPNKWS